MKRITVFPAVGRCRDASQATDGRLVQIRSMSELAKTVASEAWSNIVFKDNKRSKNNFLYADFLAADIDGGLSLVQAEKRLARLGLEYSITLTRNHQRTKSTRGKAGNPASQGPCDRFRIVLTTARRISSAAEFDSAMACLRSLFPELDEKCRDRGRFYFASTGGVYKCGKGRPFELKSFEVPITEDASGLAKALGFNKELVTQHEFGTKPLWSGGVEFLRNAYSEFPGEWNARLNLTAFSASLLGWTEDEFTAAFKKAAPDPDDRADLSVIRSAMAAASTKAPLGESSSKRKTSAVALAVVEPSLRLLQSQTGKAYAQITDGSAPPYCVPVENNDGLLTDFVIRQFYRKYRQPLGSSALDEVIQTLKARAKHEAKKEPLHLRTGKLGNRVFVYTARPEAFCIEVIENDTADPFAESFKLHATAPINFLASDDLLPSPALEVFVDFSIRECFGLLFDLLGIHDEQSRLLIATWMVSAMIPEQGSYAVLVLQGEQGSGKTTLAEFIQAVLDPRGSGLAALPKEERDLFIHANDSYICCFDNTGQIKPEISDALCKLATGASYCSRALYFDSKRLILRACRPILFNGINGTPERPDLLDRAIVIEMPHLRKKASKSTLRERFSEVESDVFVGVIRALAICLPKLRERSEPSEFRMADFARCGVIMEGVFGLPKGFFSEAYRANLTQSSLLVVMGDPVAAAIVRAFEPGEETCLSSASLFAKALPFVRDEQRRYFPKDPARFSRRLRQIAPELRRQGFKIDFPRSASARTIWIKTPPPDASIWREKEDDTSDGADSGFSDLEGGVSDESLALQ
jgi:hypothetical protein